jgi:hypothetical protein
MTTGPVCLGRRLHPATDRKAWDPEKHGGSGCFFFAAALESARGPEVESF